MSTFEACYNSRDYIMSICNVVAIPVIQSGRIAIFLYRASQFAGRMTPDNPYFYNMEYEIYLRNSRKINEKFVRNCLGAPMRVIPVLTVSRFDDIPLHRGNLAGGFEILCALECGGVHVGDDMLQCDIIHPIYGRIECKFKAGRIISQAKKKEGD